jgi:hypothetical protein
MMAAAKVSTICSRCFLSLTSGGDSAIVDPVARN